MQPNIWIWVWVIAAVVLAVAELFTRGWFVLPFAIGSATAAGLELAWPGSVNWQWGAFIGVSSIVLVIARRMIQRRTGARTAEKGD